MREAKRYRAYFDAAVNSEKKPANPWRSVQPSARPALQRAWQEELRPGAASILGYALAGLCLVGCLGIQALDGYRGVISRGAEWLLVNGQLGQQVAGFINSLPSPF